MKRLFLSIIPLTILIMGCASSAITTEDIAEMPLEQIMAEAAEHEEYAEYLDLIELIETTETPELPVINEPVITEIDTQPQEPIELPFPRVGFWRVLGRGQQGNWTANMRISEVASDTAFSGYFEWRGNMGNGGTEYFRGTYNPETRTTVIQGYRLVNPRGINIDRYEASLSSDGYNFESGTWAGGSGKWEAVWNPNP